MKTQNVKITTPANTPPEPAEVMEKAILDMAAGMRKLNDTRLRRETIVTLLHDNSKVAKRDIRLVLNNLDDLEGIFLKPKIKPAK